MPATPPDWTLAKAPTHEPWPLQPPSHAKATWAHSAPVHPAWHSHIPCTHVPWLLQSAGQRTTARSQPSPPKPGRQSHTPCPRQCPRPEHWSGQALPPLPVGRRALEYATVVMAASLEPIAKVQVGGERPSRHSQPPRRQLPCAEQPSGHALAFTSAQLAPLNPSWQWHTPITAAALATLPLCMLAAGATAESGWHSPWPEQLAGQSGTITSHARPLNPASHVQ